MSFSAAMSDPIIDMCSGLLNGSGAKNNTGVITAFDKLRAACQVQNPMYQFLKEVQTEGLTKTQMHLVMLYVVFRTKPTRGEIAHFLSLIAKSSWQEKIKNIHQNLTDEIQGEHDKLLHLCFNRFSDKLGLNSPLSYYCQLVMLLLKARREYGVTLGDCRSDIPYILPKLEKIYPGNTFLARTQDPYACMKLFDSYDHPLLSLIPQDADVYERKMEELYSTSSQDSKRLATLAGPALCLAIREKSSSEPDGISGLTKFFLETYQGYFDPRSFDDVLKWSNEHTGEEGVEDQHAKDALEIARILLSNLIQDPRSYDDVINIIQQESDRIETRTQLAEDFVQAIRDVPEKRPYEVRIEPKPEVQKQNSRMNIFRYLGIC